MGIFDNVASAIESKTTSIADYTWSELFPQTNAKSGVAVNVDSSLRVTTVFACARVLAEGIAQLPLCIFEEDSEGNHTEVKSPLVNVLARNPNDWMTSFELREQMMIHAVLTGNAYAYLGYGGGELQEIIPLVPGSVMVQRNIDWSLEYHVSDLAGRSTIVPTENILHLRGPSWNGYLGMEAIQLAREAIGLAITTEETHASLHANGAQPGGVLSVKGKLDTPARERLKAAWQAFQGGVANRFKTAVLDVDASWTPLAMTGVDSQHLETRRYQLEEICRAMRVFPQMVMHSDKTSTFASAEAFFTSHVTHSLMPWVVRWQQTLNKALFLKTPQFSVKLSVNDILKGDASARSDFYMKALGGARGETAYMTRNEVRKLEGLNPIAGGDKLLMPPTAPVTTPGAPTAPVAGDSGKSELLQFLEMKYSPDQPRGPNGQWGGGGGAGSPRSEVMRIGASITLSALAGALKGGTTGAALGAAVAAFVETGAADYVGQRMIGMFGPHVLPDWAHEMLVAHHEDYGKSIYTDTFGRMSEADKSRFCLDVLDELNEKQIQQLAEGLVAGHKSNPNHDETGRFAPGGGGGFSAASLYKGASKTADELLAQHGATELAAKVEAKLAGSTATNASVADGGHVMPNGQYTPERQQIHSDILKSVFNEKAVMAATPKNGEKPVLSVIGGRGGSGKSFITKDGGPVDSTKSILLDSDKFKAALPEYKGWNAANLHEEADMLLHKADTMATALGVNVTHDATLKSMGNSSARQAVYKDAGYDVNGYYVHASPEVAVGRALGRFTRAGENGRYVPPSVILGNTENEANFDKMKSGFKSWKIYDNNGSAPKLVGES